MWRLDDVNPFIMMAIKTVKALMIYQITNTSYGDDPMTPTKDEGMSMLPTTYGIRIPDQQKL